MTKAQKVHFIILLISISFSGYTQTISELNILEKEYHTCLDNANYMLGCTRKFYDDIDAMLNVVYKKTMSGLDEAQKNNLRTEQRDWLKKRDAYFATVDKENEDELEGNDLKMIRIDKQADYVKERVIYLIKKYK